MSVKGFVEWDRPCRSDVTTDHRWYKINTEDKGLLWANSWETITKCPIVNCLLLSVAGMPHYHNSCHLHLLVCCCQTMLLSSRVVWQQNLNFHINCPLAGICILPHELILPFHVSGRIFQLHLPLSGSGVVQFLFCLQLSSLCPCTRSALESLSVLLFIALCSSLLTRPWDRLMKSGLKSSKAS